MNLRSVKYKFSDDYHCLRLLDDEKVFFDIELEIARFYFVENILMKLGVLK